jgi:XTP/dITP diphosphohydrolase
MIKKIVLASRNRKKLEELQALLAGLGVEVAAVSAFPGSPEVEETGKTFAENAALKSEAIARFTGLPALADDSGLLVEALNGAPGVYSARFAGENATDADNNRLLLEKLRGQENRRAKFASLIAFSIPGKETVLFAGETSGVIIGAPRGENGFGYDPLFLSDDLGKTFAEAGAAEKNAISHRGRALQKFLAYCKSYPDFA